MPNLIAKDAAGRDIVAIAEPARNRQDLIVGGQPRVFQQAIQVHHIGLATRRLTRKRRFLVTVGARSTQDQNSWTHAVIVATAAPAVTRPSRPTSSPTP